MATTSEAFITPDLLVWARERTKTTPSRLAQKLKIKAGSIESWESGKTNPSIRQAEKLAQKLHVPLPYLFLPTRPKDEIPLPDFRTIENRLLDRSSPDLIDLINDVLAKHAWYKEHLQREGASVRAFVGSCGFNQSPETIAADITQTLGITDELRISCDSWQEFLTRFIERVQACGVLVMRSGTVAGNTHRPVSTDEFRGFAISDNLAPLIFINASDYQAAQIFTVGHELGHIWLGTTGISNEKLNQPDPSNIEKLCDAVAAEVLVPRDIFLDRWSRTSGEPSSVARYFRVSSLVVLRRARDLGRITQDEFHELFEREKQKYKRSESGGNFFNNLFARNSLTLTAAVISAVNEQRELYSHAAALLNVRVPTIQKISDRLTNPQPRKGGT
jgi:Zn-dependent peptidase ImmA (M78 family)/transcriptional regulator with XRE-family HTH domain